MTSFTYPTVKRPAMFAAFLLGLVALLLTVHTTLNTANLGQSRHFARSVEVTDVDWAPSRPVITHLNSDVDHHNSVIESRGGRGVQHMYETYITLINATPYRWRRGYNHSYQMMNWEMHWPEYIESGQSFQMLAQINLLFKTGDAAGDVAYHLEGTNKPMSFMVRYLPKDHNIRVDFLEELQTSNNAKYTQHEMKFTRFPGGSSFVLAGTEDNFISNDGPIQWMQSQFNEIGHLPLKEIVFPRSHHAGGWKNSEPLGGGIWKNCQTQNLPLYHQLGNGGIRVLDVRPILRNKRFHEHHGSWGAGSYHGMVGASLREMIDTFNQFMDDYPGELYIWDIHREDARNGDDGFSSLSDDDRKQLYSELKRIKYRFPVEDKKDLTNEPLSKFVYIAGRDPTTPMKSLVNEGKSAVLIRVDAEWSTLPHFPGGKQGFVSGINFPLHSSWSDTNDDRHMAADQVAQWHKARPRRNATMHNADWLITQQGAQAIFGPDSIMDLAVKAWRMLAHEFWYGLTDDSYPNMVTMDLIHENFQKALVMTMNKCFAAKRCGSLGGMVRGKPGEGNSGDFEGKGGKVVS